MSSTNNPQFSSREQFNTDPLPWVCDTHGRACRWPGTADETQRGRTFAPLATHNHPAHNPTNVVIAAARLTLAEGATVVDIADDLNGFQVSYPGCEQLEAAIDAADSDTIVHARAVFTRLTAIGGAA